MNNKAKKHLASILTILMVFSFLPIGLYADTVPVKQSVTLEVRGSAENGVIYHNKEVSFNKGDSAFDILKRKMDENNIPLEYDEEWKFVTGINGLNQQELGPNSGWLYKWNHTSPDVGAGDTILKDGDHVLFYYTLDYSKDEETDTPEEVEEVAPIFSDKGDVSPWALESVERAIDLNLIGGDHKGKLNPRKNITRAEFVKLLLVIMNEEPDTTFKGTFTDVSKDAWYAGVVEKAAELGMVNGTDTGKFLPKDTISRQDMAVILTKAFLRDDLANKVIKPSDADQISPYALESVAKVLANGIMSGVDNNKFNPKGNATREMAITVLIRILGVNK